MLSSALLPYLIGLADLVLAAIASSHAILHKREVRAAIGWVGLIWLVPFGGALLYLILGVNRIRRRGTRIQEEITLLSDSRAAALPPPVDHQDLPAVTRSIGGVARAVGEVTQLPLMPGNRVDPLVCGDEAYPAMIAAIESASSTIMLQSYIFDVDRAGKEFIEALDRAHRRGVAVRVLIDGVGAAYSKPKATQVLRQRGVPVEEFMGQLVPWRMPYLNLRNHRKILVVDGRIGFTGGMNIREGTVLSLDSTYPVRDLHFRLEGPVVRHLAETFARDWVFASGEELFSPGWFPRLQMCGEAVARGVSDGPDDEFERLYNTFLAALSGADETVRIITPYFLPDNALLSALRTAVLRGVHVDVVLPLRSNLRVVGWAMSGQLDQVLDAGCHVWLSPEPFDHTKLILVDGSWVFFGSGNWDPRSYRLNFEFNVEVYDRELAERMEVFSAERIAASRPASLAELRDRHLALRLRDGVAWLFSPYL
ncbi:MAG: phospholipase D-like domain-containing protein [marine benthic group bacterium]|nr:phospholipase D-like domain-containing protein [Gemmatimonadota bacterium]